jgi:hypothetical protein
MFPFRADHLLPVVHAAFDELESSALIMESKFEDATDSGRTRVFAFTPKRGLGPLRKSTLSTTSRTTMFIVLVF